MTEPRQPCPECHGNKTTPMFIDDICVEGPPCEFCDATGEVDATRAFLREYEALCRKYGMRLAGFKMRIQPEQGLHLQMKRLRRLARLRQDSEGK